MGMRQSGVLEPLNAWSNKPPTGQIKVGRGSGDKEVVTYVTWLKLLLEEGAVTVFFLGKCGKSEFYQYCKNN